MTADSPGRTPFITRLQISGFRSLAECDVSFGQLTVLVGLNASGKSNFLDALRFIRDAVTTSPLEAISNRGGIDVVFHHVGHDIVNLLSIELHAILSPQGEGSDRGCTARYGFELDNGPSSIRDGVSITSEWCEIADSAGRVVNGYLRDEDCVRHISGEMIGTSALPSDLWLRTAAVNDRQLAEFLLVTETHIDIYAGSWTDADATAA